MSRNINRQLDFCNSKAEMLNHGDNGMSGELENGVLSMVESAPHPASVDATKSFVWLPFITQKLSLKVKKFYII